MSLSLKIHDVSVLYPGQQKGQPVRALSGVNLDIAAGDFVVALGASGCGKTTLLNLMAGFISPAAGSLRWGIITAKCLLISTVPNCAIKSRAQVKNGAWCSKNTHCCRG